VGVGGEVDEVVLLLALRLVGIASTPDEIKSARVMDIGMFISVQSVSRSIATMMSSNLPHRAPRQ